MIAKLSAKPAADAKRIGLESGALSILFSHELNCLGLPIACLDACKVKAALMPALNKTDANDAFGSIRHAASASIGCVLPPSETIIVDSKGCHRTYSHRYHVVWATKYR